MSEQREANLKRWSELAPGECTIRSHSIEVGILSSTIGTSSGFHMNPELTFCDRAVLLSALIEAIRARGWHYALTDEGDEHLAGVIPSPNPLGAGERFAAEPCDALLSAYVQ